MGNLAEQLDRLSEAATLVERMPDRAVRCTACGHRCLVRDGRRGICQVRFNRAGELRLPWGYVAGLQVDPTEKKPFYHLLPGSGTLTFGMLGCNFHCSFCQNWISSQALRDPEADVSIGHLRRISPEAIVETALRLGASVIASSYNEPLITAEWAGAIFERASREGLHCAIVSNGYASPEVVDFLRPHLTAFKIDLKSMQDRRYRTLGGTLNKVLDTIRLAHERGLWVEIVTLVVPGFNDSTDELMDLARFVASVSPDIPWHATAFHQDYRMLEARPTSPADLVRAAEIGQEAGLHYVYAGNLPGRVRTYETTCCPSCGSALIERRGFSLLDDRLTEGGACPSCGQTIAGVWRTASHPAVRAPAARRSDHAAG
jgi:pyruvate formate lyase activating enzyme